MILIGVAIVSWGAVWLMATWRDVEAKALRWKLYALRDQIRMLAIDGRAQAGGALFRRLDASMSSFCDGSGVLSFWVLMPLVLVAQKSDRLQEEQFKRELQRPENAELRKCFDEAAHSILLYLIKRHILMVAVLIPTVVGFFLLYRAMEKVSNAVASGSVENMNPHAGGLTTAS